MNSKVEPKKNRFDTVKWVIIAVLIAAGVYANFYYSTVAFSLRFIGWLMLAGILVAIVLQTTVGKNAWLFLLEARMEMRKVVWPTRQETVQTTMLVVAMVVVTALILWGVDSFLLWAVGLLTGQTTG